MSNSPTLLPFRFFNFDRKNKLLEAKLKPMVEELTELHEDEAERTKLLAELYKKEGYNHLPLAIIQFIKFSLFFGFFLLVINNTDLFRISIDNISFFGIKDLTRSGFSFLTLAYLFLTFTSQFISARIQKNTKDKYWKSLTEEQKKELRLESASKKGSDIEGLTDEQIEILQKEVNKKEIIRIMTGAAPMYGLITLVSFVLSRSILVYYVASSGVKLIFSLIDLIKSK